MYTGTWGTQSSFMKAVGYCWIIKRAAFIPEALDKYAFFYINRKIYIYTIIIELRVNVQKIFPPVFFLITNK